MFYLLHILERLLLIHQTYWVDYRWLGVVQWHKFPQLNIVTGVLNCLKKLSRRVQKRWFWYHNAILIQSHHHFCVLFISLEQRNYISLLETSCRSADHIGFLIHTNFVSINTYSIQKRSSMTKWAQSQSHHLWADLRADREISVGQTYRRILYRQ